ncbi:MAG: divergent polysaccharide deacetylase family protein [Alphaproteobacteria bacterium]|nr:divergent polysaccharide deacetylase family protein [Alphaproteobacteria bacterium]MDX5368280.1 divergent polysaccharide deacetylase family protein [Alphaproteobacteria bacterium]MDX5463086.1 divergent polysaccharide deacetylase family protein [Alphaproteobacteria bacterium]
MRRMTVARWSLSVALVAVLGGAGLLAGWLPREAPDVQRGKQVVILAMTPEGAPPEVLLSEPERGVAPFAPTAPVAPRPTGTGGGPAPSTASADAAGREGGTGTQDSGAPAGDVLVITLPPAGRAESGGESAPADDRPVPDITPNPPRGYGPVTPLAAAPVAAVTEDTPAGPLPRISGDGAKPREVYARPFDAPQGTPLIALVIAGVGLDHNTSLAAIRDLPGAVTLALAPYPPRIGDWAREAREAGHELLLEVPMEPFSADQEPGPSALLTSISPSENVLRLQWLMSRFPGFVGVTNYLGGRFTTDPVRMQAVANELAARGLLFLESGGTRQSQAQQASGAAGLPFARATRVIDLTPAAGDVRARLAELVTAARETGVAIGVGAAIPGTIEAVAGWAPTLEASGVRLAPLSAVVARKDTP